MPLLLQLSRCSLPSLCKLAIELLEPCALCHLRGLSRLLSSPAESHLFSFSKRCLAPCPSFSLSRLSRDLTLDLAGHYRG